MMQGRNKQLIRKNISYKLFLCGMATLCAMYLHEFFPVKKLSLIPSKDVHAYIYGEKNASGEKVVSWINEESRQWRCNFDTKIKMHMCGLSLTLGEGEGSTGIDLSGYDRVNIDLGYSGEKDAKKIRFYFRSYIPGFSEINRIDTTQFINVLVPLQDLSPNLVLTFNEFSVAEWWLSEKNVPRKLVFPDFKRLMVFGIDVPAEVELGQFDFQLNKLELEGEWVSKEQWYQGILTFWMLIIFFGGAYQLWMLKRENFEEHARLENLIHQNASLKDEADHYKNLSMLDQLTGLLNRHGLSTFIERNYREDVYQLVSLIIIDLDFFKKVNDTCGHEGGDIVLKEVAKILRSNTRSEDCVARWGGEEFVALLPNTSLDDALKVAENLRLLVERAHFEMLPDLQVTISLGVGAIEGIEPFHMLFRRVDIALYQAKVAGRNRVMRAY